MLHVPQKELLTLFALSQVDLTVSSGEIYGFLGPNGAGKTTTIKLLTGLLTPTTGQCLIQGIDVTKQPASVHQHCGVVTEHSQMYDYMTGLENLLLGKRGQNRRSVVFSSHFCFL